MDASGKIKVVCMGDSITEGFGVGPRECYPARLQELLGENYEVFNQGVCCSTVNNILLEGRPMGLPYARQERYREGLKRKGDIYLVLLGTNDAQDGMSDTEDVADPYLNMIACKEEFEQHYEAILNGIREAAPKARIYIGIPAPVMQCIWRRHQEKYLLQLFPYFDRIREKNPDIRIFDVHKAFMALPEQERLTLYQEDCLHPNAKGAQLIARTVYEALQTEGVRSGGCLDRL